MWCQRLQQGNMQTCRGQRGSATLSQQFILAKVTVHAVWPMSG